VLPGASVPLDLERLSPHTAPSDSRRTRVLNCGSIRGSLKSVGRNEDAVSGGVKDDRVELPRTR
jgi:hypothetical protein